MLTVKAAPGGHHDEQVESEGVAGQVQHQEDAGHPHQQFGGAHLRLRHQAVLNPPLPPLPPPPSPSPLPPSPRLPSLPGSGPQRPVTPPEAAHGEDDAQVEGEDEGEGQGEGDEEVDVGEDGQELQVALLLLARGVHGAERPVRGEEAVEVEEECEERDEADGRSGVSLGAQHGGAQRVADSDVALQHQQHQVPR